MIPYFVIVQHLFFYKNLIQYLMVDHHESIVQNKLRKFSITRLLDPLNAIVFYEV